MICVDVVQGLVDKPHVCELFQMKCARCTKAMAIESWILLAQGQSQDEVIVASQAPTPSRHHEGRLFCRYCHLRVLPKASEEWYQIRIAESVFLERVVRLLDQLEASSPIAFDNLMWQHRGLMDQTLVSQNIHRRMRQKGDEDHRRRVRCNIHIYMYWQRSHPTYLEGE